MIIDCAQEDVSALGSLARTAKSTLPRACYHMFGSVTCKAKRLGHSSCTDFEFLRARPWLALYVRQLTLTGGGFTTISGLGLDICTVHGWVAMLPGLKTLVLDSAAWLWCVSCNLQSPAERKPHINVEELELRDTWAYSVLPDLGTLTALFPNLRRVSCRGVQCATRVEDSTPASAIEQLVVECPRRQAASNVEPAVMPTGSARHVHLQAVQPRYRRILQRVLEANRNAMRSLIVEVIQPGTSLDRHRCKR